MLRECTLRKIFYSAFNLFIFIDARIIEMVQAHDRSFSDKMFHVTEWEIDFISVVHRLDILDSWKLDSHKIINLSRKCLLFIHYLAFFNPFLGKIHCSGIFLPVIHLLCLSLLLRQRHQFPLIVLLVFNDKEWWKEHEIFK